jgi:hypothetical protein
MGRDEVVPLVPAICLFNTDRSVRTPPKALALAIESRESVFARHSRDKVFHACRRFWYCQLYFAIFVSEIVNAPTSAGCEKRPGEEDVFNLPADDSGKR